MWGEDRGEKRPERSEGKRGEKIGERKDRRGG